jgi:glucan phosphorylase
MKPCWKSGLVNCRKPEKQVRMAHLACVGSHAINGVAALHTELLKRGTLHDFYVLYPDGSPAKPTALPPAGGCSSAIPACRN